MVELAAFKRTVHPFDSVAAEYDREFTRTRLGRWLRAAVWESLERHFSAGQHVLELGTGTGEDALWLARRGVRVTATDAAAGMLAIARRKAEAAGLDDCLSFAQLDFNVPGFRAPGVRPYDGVLANFGVINCCADRRRLAEEMAGRLRAGGRVVLVTMGPLCAWEIVWHLGHGEVRRAFRRLRRGTTGELRGGARLPVWYPSPRRLDRDLAPWFRRVERAGIGLFLPPTYLCHLPERWPRTFDRLHRLERRTARSSPSIWFADHHLAVFERR